MPSIDMGFISCLLHKLCSLATRSRPEGRLQKRDAVKMLLY